MPEFTYKGVAALFTGVKGGGCLVNPTEAPLVGDRFKVLIWGPQSARLWLLTEWPQAGWHLCLSFTVDITWKAPTHGLVRDPRASRWWVLGWGLTAMLAPGIQGLVRAVRCGGHCVCVSLPRPPSLGRSSWVGRSDSGSWDFPNYSQNACQHQQQQRKCSEAQQTDLENAGLCEANPFPLCISSSLVLSCPRGSRGSDRRQERSLFHKCRSPQNAFFMDY